MSTGGGGISHCMLGYTSPWSDTPWLTPPWADTSLDRHLPWADTPLQTTPWEDTPCPLRCAVYAGIRSTNGRYTSHWNVFLLYISFAITKCIDLRFGAPRYIFRFAKKKPSITLLSFLNFDLWHMTVQPDGLSHLLTVTILSGCSTRILCFA